MEIGKTKTYRIALPPDEPKPNVSTVRSDFFNSLHTRATERLRQPDIGFEPKMNDAARFPKVANAQGAEIEKFNEGPSTSIRVDGVMLTEYDCLSYGNKEERD